MQSHTLENSDSLGEQFIQACHLIEFGHLKELEKYLDEHPTLISYSDNINPCSKTAIPHRPVSLNVILWNETLSPTDAFDKAAHCLLPSFYQCRPTLIKTQEGDHWLLAYDGERWSIHKLNAEEDQLLHLLNLNENQLIDISKENELFHLLKKHHTFSHFNKIHYYEKILARDFTLLSSQKRESFCHGKKMWSLDLKRYTLLEIACQVGQFDIFQTILKRSSDYAKQKGSAKLTHLIPMTASNEMTENELATLYMLIIRLFYNPHLQDKKLDSFSLLGSQFDVQEDLDLIYEINTGEGFIPSEDLKFLIHSSNIQPINPHQAIEENQATTSHIEENQATTSHIEENQAITSHIEENQATTSHIEENQAITSHIEENQAPTSHIEENQAPTSHIEENQATTSPIEKNQATTSNVTPIIEKKSEVAPAPTSNKASTHNPLNPFNAFDLDFIKQNKQSYLNLFKNGSTIFTSNKTLSLIMEKWIFHPNIVDHYATLHQIGLLDCLFKSKEKDKAFERRTQHEGGMLFDLKQLQYSLRMTPENDVNQSIFWAQFSCTFLKYSYSPQFLKMNLIHWKDTDYPIAKLINAIPASETFEGALYALLTLECMPKKSTDYFDFFSTFQMPGFSVLLATEFQWKCSPNIPRNNPDLPVLIQMQNGEYHFYGYSHLGKPLYSSFTKNQFNIPRDWSFTKGDIVYIYANDPMFSVLSNAHFIKKASLTELSNIVLTQLIKFRQQANITQAPPFIYIYGSAALAKLTNSYPSDIDVCWHLPEHVDTPNFPFAVKKTAHPLIDLYHREIEPNMIEYDLSISIRKGPILASIKKSDFTIHHIFFNIFLNQHTYWTFESKEHLFRKKLIPSNLSIDTMDETQALRYLISSAKYKFCANNATIHQFQKQANHNLTSSKMNQGPFLPPIFSKQKMDSLFLKPSFLNGDAFYYFKYAHLYRLLERILPFDVHQIQSLQLDSPSLVTQFDQIHSKNPICSTYQQKIQKSAQIIAHIIFYGNQLNNQSLAFIRLIKKEIGKRFSNKALIQEIFSCQDRLLHQYNSMYHPQETKMTPSSRAKLDIQTNAQTLGEPQDFHEVSNTFANFLVNTDLSHIKNYLILYPDLIQQAFSFCDRSNRVFENISPLQYAYWARDIKLTQFFLTKIDKKSALEQLVHFEQNHYLYSQHGASFSLAPIIFVLRHYHQNKLKMGIRINSWKKNIGSLQKNFPAWLALAMSEPLENKWNQNFLSTIQIQDKHHQSNHNLYLDLWFGTEHYHSGLGTHFAFYRGTKSYLASVPCVYAGHPMSIQDLQIFEKLSEKLELYFENLISDLSLSAHSTPPSFYLNQNTFFHMPISQDHPNSGNTYSY